jgi:hypothetical protein
MDGDMELNAQHMGRHGVNCTTYEWRYGDHELYNIWMEIWSELSNIWMEIWSELYNI